MRYRTLTEDGEHPRELWLAERALRVFSQKLKNREGRIGSVKLRFDEKTVSFAEWTEF